MTTTQSYNKTQFAQIRDARDHYFGLKDEDGKPTDALKKLWACISDCWGPGQGTTPEEKETHRKARFESYCQFIAGVRYTLAQNKLTLTGLRGYDKEYDLWYFVTDTRAKAKVIPVSTIQGLNAFTEIKGEAYVPAKAEVTRDEINDKLASKLFTGPI